MVLEFNSIYFLEILIDLRYIKKKCVPYYLTLCSHKITDI